MSVARPVHMIKEPTETYRILEDNPAAIGPDYVALVIEWDDSGAVDDQVTTTQWRVGLPIRRVAAAVSALGALLFAAWGIHRLRA